MKVLIHRFFLNLSEVSASAKVKETIVWFHYEAFALPTKACRRLPGGDASGMLTEENFGLDGVQAGTVAEEVVGARAATLVGPGRRIANDGHAQAGVDADDGEIRRPLIG